LYESDLTNIATLSINTSQLEGIV